MQEKARITMATSDSADKDKTPNSVSDIQNKSISTTAFQNKTTIQNGSVSEKYELHVEESKPCITVGR